MTLIEAGGRDWNPLIHIPVGNMKLLDHKQLSWGFKTEADPGTRDLSNLAHRRQRVIAGLEAAAVDMSVVDPEMRWHGTFRRLPLR